MQGSRVLIDVTATMPVIGSIGGYISGVGQSIISLINAFNRIEDLPLNIELYATTFRSMNCDFYDWKFKHHVLPFPTRLKLKGRLLDSYVRPRILNYDLFHIPANYQDVSPNEPFVVTIHDCTDMDSRMNIDMEHSVVEKLRKKYNYMAKCSRAIFTVSEFSKSEIVHFLGADPDKIHVAYWGIDIERFKKIPESAVNNVLNKYGIRKPYFFACSCNRPRKNLITALRAFKKFLTTNPKHIFVVAWSNPFPEILKEFSNEIGSGKIVFLPFLTDEELVAFYNGASASIYISLKEGFGLPILESFACGTPVITCQNSSIPEVGKDAAIYVGEYNVDDIVDVMKKFEVGSYDLKEFLIKSECVVNDFTWQKTANKYLGVYKSYM